MLSPFQDLYTHYLIHYFKEGSHSRSFLMSRQGIHSTTTQSSTANIGRARMKVCLTQKSTLQYTLFYCDFFVCALNLDIDLQNKFGIDCMKTVVSRMVRITKRTETWPGLQGICNLVRLGDPSKWESTKCPSK